MTPAIDNIEKPARGRPRVDATPVLVRLPSAQLAALDEWISVQPGNLSRPEAVRQLIAVGIAVASAHHVPDPLTPPFAVNDRVVNATYGAGTVARPARWLSNAEARVATGTAEEGWFIAVCWDAEEWGVVDVMDRALDHLAADE